LFGSLLADRYIAKLSLLLKKSSHGQACEAFVFPDFSGTRRSCLNQSLHIALQYFENYAIIAFLGAVLVTQPTN
jgi:hypothetical protein